MKLRERIAWVLTGALALTTLASAGSALAYCGPPYGPATLCQGALPGSGTACPQSYVIYQAVQPSATPSPVAAAAPTALPVPGLSVSDSYSTSNGVRTSGQIQTELLQAGYGGPFDVSSLLAAYQRTTGQAVRPL